MAMNGAQVLILVNTSTTATPTYVAVAEQTGLSLETSRNLIEVSSKNNDHATFVYGRQSDKLSLEAMYVPSDAAMSALQDAMENKTSIKIRRSEDGTSVEEADALVASIKKDFPDQDASKVSVEFQLNSGFGPVTP